jgi:hypothetical protein
MADKYATEEAAVTALRPGWHIVGRAPYEIETVNPAATVPGPDGKIDPLAPPKIKQTIGTILSIEGPDGTPDKMTVSNPSAADFTNPNRQSGPVISVIEGPAKGPPTGTNKPSDPTKWVNVVRPGTVDVVGLWDPVNADFHPIAAAPGAQPSGKFDPAIVTDTAPDGTTTQRQVGLIDTGDKSFHPLAAPPSPNPSGKYENQYVTNADGSKRLVGMTDTGDKHFIPVSADPTTQKRTIQTPTAVYSVDDNDNVKKLIDIDKSVPMQAVVIDGEVFSFDPNEKDPTKRLTSIQSARPPAQIKQGDTTYIRKDNPDGTFEYTLPPGITKAAALQTNTTAKTLDWYDDNGNLIKSVKNTNYIEPKVDAAVPPATNLVAKRIQIPDPDHPGQLKWIDNEARVTASQALQNIASTLSGQVVNGDISVDEAKAIIDGANAAMATQATAAAASLSAINQGATAGANLLNQRSQAAQNLVQQGLGPLGQTKHGLLVAPGADFGQNLVQGAAGFATELGGGPEVFQAAANLVRRADPSGSMGQDAAGAFATLTQMFQKYRQATGGQPHPAEVEAIQGGAQGGAGTGQQANTRAFAAPPQAAPAIAPEWQRADQMYGTTPAGNAVAAAGLAGTVPVGSPQYLGFKAPFQQSGLSEGRSVAPTATVPMPAQPTFAAPQMAVTPMQTVQPQARNITITVPTG